MVEGAVVHLVEGYLLEGALLVVGLHVGYWLEFDLNGLAQDSLLIYFLIIILLSVR